MDVHSDMQRAAFDLPSNFLNPRVSCNSQPAIDLNAWRESAGSGCVIGDRQVQVGESAFPSPCTSCICTERGVSHNLPFGVEDSNPSRLELKSKE